MAGQLQLQGLLPVKRLVMGSGCRETRKAGCGEGQPTPVLPPTVGSASCQAHTSCFCSRVSASSRRPRRLLAVTARPSVNWDLIGMHLDEEDVTDDAVWLLLRHQLQRGSFHVVLAGPPSPTFAPHVRDLQHVFGIPKSTARKRVLDQ